MTHRCFNSSDYQLIPFSLWFLVELLKAHLLSGYGHWRFSQGICDLKALGCLNFLAVLFNNIARLVTGYLKGWYSLHCVVDLKD